MKQAFPNFTPAQIKSALVQSAANVVRPFSDGVSGVLAYGNGLLNAGAAVSVPATVVPSSISLGTNTPGTILNQSINLAITNVTGAADTLVLSQTGGSSTVSLAATPSTLTLGSGETQSVTIQASSSQPVTGAPEGTLLLHSQNTGKDLAIPFWGNFLVPSANTNGTVNAASLTSGPVRVSAGSLVSIFGTQLTAGATAYANSIPLPSSLAGTELLVQGVAMPLLYVSPTQINAQVPQEVSGRTLATLQIRLNGVTGPTSFISLAPTGPGIFAINQAGTGRGAILHSSTHGAVTSSDPARPGEILEVYANGLGATTPPVATGQAASIPPSIANVAPSASIGAVPATVRFAGLAPGFVALYQVNVEVPANAPVGDDQLILFSNGVSSNPVTVSIGR